MTKFVVIPGQGSDADSLQPAPTLFRLDPDVLRTEMVEAGMDVRTLATAADLSDKTVYTVLHGTPVTLRTAGKIRRAIRTAAV